MNERERVTLRYSYHGLKVDCPFPIAEWALFEIAREDTIADVSIVVDLTAHDEMSPAEDGTHRFFVKDAGWFTVMRGAKIVITPGQFPIARRTRAFLTGSAWGALLYQRGLLPVHASAVESDDGAFLFCGRRGSGKSTLAALLSERGYRLISDDLCCVHMKNEGLPMVYPSVPRFKLWDDAIHELGWDRSEPIQDLMRADKFHFIRPSARAMQPVAVRALYLLSWGKDGIERVKGLSALNRVFHAGTWRGDLLVAAGDPAEHFRKCANLVHQVSIQQFRRVRNLTSLRESTNLLVRHLSENKTHLGGIPHDSC
jgi:hypothetical protein